MSGMQTNMFVPILFCLFMNLRDPACPACKQTCLYTRFILLSYLACSACKQTCLYTFYFATSPTTLSHSRPFPIIDNSVMGPKPKIKSKPNTRSGATHTRPVSRKRQASNADELPSKRTRHTTKKPDDDDDEEPEQEEVEEAHEEEEDEEDDVVDPPPSRSGKRGHGIKVGPPPRYVGHSQSCPFLYILPFF